MSDIKRYKPQTFEESDHGMVVMYEDHVAVLAELEAGGVQAETSLRLRLLWALQEQYPALGVASGLDSALKALIIYAKERDTLRARAEDAEKLVEGVRDLRDGLKASMDECADCEKCLERIHEGCAVPDFYAEVFALLAAHEENNEK